jgi:hypothetical protein
LGSDPRRWGNPKSYPRDWDRRAAIAASWINEKDSCVLDVGCGPMKLRGMISVPVRYVGADLNPWLPEVIKIDLNRGEYPVGEFDYSVFLGVLEYLEKPETALRNARLHSRKLIVSYCLMTLKDVAARKGRGWISHMDRDEFEMLLRTTGWMISEQRSYQEQRDYNQRLYLCG